MNIKICKKVWWKCLNCNYEWQASPNNRIKKQHMCPQCRKNMHPQNATRVINVETGEIFNSIATAAKSVNVSRTNISSCCRGITKSAAGYHWRYYQ